MCNTIHLTIVIATATSSREERSGEREENNNKALKVFAIFFLSLYLDECIYIRRTIITYYLFTHA